MRWLGPGATRRAMKAERFRAHMHDRDVQHFEDVALPGLFGDAVPPAAADEAAWQLKQWLSIERTPVVWPQADVARGVEFIQTDLTTKFRSILCDWLLELDDKRLRCGAPVVTTAVALSDIYLSKKVISRSQLQLLGVAAYFLASKLHNIYPALLRDMRHCTARAYSCEEIADMETSIGQVLQWRFRVPTTHVFVKLLTAVCAEVLKTTSQQHAEFDCFVQGCVRIALVTGNLRTWTPSVVAQAILVLARVKYGLRPYWSRKLAIFTGDADSEGGPLGASTQECVFHLLATCEAAPAAQLKQALVNHECAGRLPSHEQLREAFRELVADADKIELNSTQEVVVRVP